PRLAYADWLSQAGDPFSDFIRIQCRLARSDPNDPAYPSLRDTEQQLFTRHAPSWLGDSVVETEQEVKESFHCPPSPDKFTWETNPAAPPPPRGLGTLQFLPEQPPPAFTGAATGGPSPPVRFSGPGSRSHQIARRPACGTAPRPARDPGHPPGRGRSPCEGL